MTDTKPILWWTTGNDPGQLIPEGAKMGPDLAWPSKLALDGIPTAIFSGGYICVFGPHGGKVLEQRYKTDGNPVETAAEVNVPTDMTESLLPRWLEVVFLTRWDFRLGQACFANGQNPPKGPAIRPPVAAPVILALAAGLLDALPVIAAIFYLAFKTDALNDPDKIPAVHAIIILGERCADLHPAHFDRGSVDGPIARQMGLWIEGSDAGGGSAGKVAASDPQPASGD